MRKRRNFIEPEDANFNFSTPKCLFEAFDMVVKAAHNSELIDEYFKAAKIPLNYLSNRLNLTHRQITFLAIIMEHDHGASISDISDYLDCSNMMVMAYDEDFRLLKDLRLIRECEGMNGLNYKVPRAVLNAYRKNEAFKYMPPVCNDNNDVYLALDNLTSLRSDSEMDISTFQKEVVDVLERNKTIGMAKTLLTYHHRLKKGDFFALLGFVMYWLHHNDNEVEIGQLRFILGTRMEVTRVSNELTKGISPLMKYKLVEVADREGFNAQNHYKLTDDFKHKIFPEVITKGEVVNDSHLRSHKEMMLKPMFYNPMEEKQVDRLTKLLAPRQTNAILKRLQDNHMRGGFTILLYGGPGTGKTETVQQLARRSGRDLYVVEVSQLRDKWYGESEKHVKHLFDNYREIVKQSKVAPILFFNECDAIFNKRMENAERSVDKSENALQNIILQEMETLNGVLIATTNLATSLDKAFERRFLYKLELTKPQPAVKSKIWKSMMKQLTLQETEILGRDYDFSGGQIENVARKCTIEEIMTGNKTTFAMLKNFCDEECIQTTTTSRQIGFGH